MSHHRYSGSGEYPQTNQSPRPPSAQYTTPLQGYTPVHHGQPRSQPYIQQYPQQGYGQPGQSSQQQDPRQGYGQSQHYPQQHNSQHQYPQQQYPQQHYTQQHYTQPHQTQPSAVHAHDWQLIGPNGHAQPSPRSYEPPGVDVHTPSFQGRIGHSPASGIGASAPQARMQQSHNGSYADPPQPQYGTYTPPQGSSSALPASQTSYSGPTATVLPVQTQGPPTPASTGYVPGQVSPRDLQVEADRLWKAMDGVGTDEESVIRILTGLNPLEIAKLGRTYDDKYGQKKKRNMIEELRKETSFNFQKAILAIARGPLAQDVYLLHKFIEESISPESLLLRDEVLMGRSNADIIAIKREYVRVHGAGLARVMEAKLAKSQPACQKLFNIVLNAERSEDSVHPDTQHIVPAAYGLQHGDSDNFYGLLLRNDEQIRAINAQCHWQSGKDLLALLSERFHPNPADINSKNTPAALAPIKLFITRALYRANSDAGQLVHAKTGLNFDYKVLTNVIVRCHWDRSHMDAVRAAFRVQNNISLTEWLCNELSCDDFRSTLLSCVAGRFVGKRDKVVD